MNSLVETTTNMQAQHLKRIPEVLSVYFVIIYPFDISPVICSNFIQIDSFNETIQIFIMEKVSTWRLKILASSVL